MSKPEETLVPARNFTLTLEERVRALGGPPAYIRRKRQIEDLEQALEARVATLACAAEGAALDAAARRRAVSTGAVLRDLARLNDLIDRHNRYYPTEANLPIDPRTGCLLEHGAPWRPLPPVRLDDLLARAAA